MSGVNKSEDTPPIPGPEKLGSTIALVYRML